MKERVLKLCRRLDKFTLDEISTIAEDIDESVLELLLLTLVQEGKLIFKDNIYLYNKEQGCNKQRLPQFFQHHSKTDIDYIIKGFCIDIEVLKMIDLFGFSKHVMNNFYQYFRTIIYEQQKNELVKYFEKSPKIPQERIYMNTKVYLYLYEHKLFVSDIVDEIQRIKNNIANAYLECETKGATIPENKNSENLPETINSIQNKGVSSKHNITMDNIFGDVDSDGLLQSPAAGNLVASGIIKVDDYKLACKFGGNAWGVTRPQGLATILFPDLTYIGNAALSYFCTYSTDLESVSFPELEEIGQCGMYCGFQHNTKLKSISFPKLKKLSGMYNSLNSVCAYCTNLEVVNLDSLTNLTSNALCSAFQNCTKLKTLSFPSLTPQSFNNYDNQFYNMLDNVTGCTVHFPYAIKKNIEEWEDVISGFGGKNTIILFDLHAVYLNFISDKQNIKISVNNEIFTEMSGYAVAGNVDYACYSQ